MARGQPTNLVREEAGSRRRKFRWSERGPEEEGRAGEEVRRRKGGADVRGIKAKRRKLSGPRNG
jgi:hypothetical protein